MIFETDGVHVGIDRLQEVIANNILFIPKQFCCRIGLRNSKTQSSTKSKTNTNWKKKSKKK